MIIGTAPGFADASAQDFHLIEGSGAIDTGTVLNSDVLPANALLRQYVKHLSSEIRPVVGPFDLGAFEYSVSLPPVITTVSLPHSVRMRWYDQTLQYTGGTGQVTWSVSSGSLPRGMTLDPVSGTIYGRARLKGTSTFTIAVTDSLNLTSTKQFTVESRLHF